MTHVFLRFKIKFSYLTVTIGIDPGYIRENFYDKVSLLYYKDTAISNKQWNIYI